MRAELPSLVFLTCLAAAGATEPDGITVLGTGEVSKMPDTMELHARIRGAAELGGDAIVKYVEAKRRTLAALERLKLKNFKAEAGGLSIAAAGDNAAQAETPPLIAPGQGPVAKTAIQFASTLRLTLSGIQDMPEEKLMQTVSQLLDTLQDAGVPVAPELADDVVYVNTPNLDRSEQPIANFLLENTSELRERAYQQAFASARSNAERLAKLAGVRLGRVQAIHEAQAQASDTGTETPNDWSKVRLASPKFAPVPVRVTLQVRFEIDK
ncbi:MAG: SIMPL domain-containing protein [Planctomycetes bacterium]|nr:SIMPL domain-containing protein [Planctomycetota bacterium]